MICRKYFGASAHLGSPLLAVCEYFSTFNDTSVNTSKSVPSLSRTAITARSLNIVGTHYDWMFEVGLGIFRFLLAFIMFCGGGATMVWTNNLNNYFVIGPQNRWSGILAIPLSNALHADLSVFRLYVSVNREEVDSNQALTSVRLGVVGESPCVVLI